MRVKFRFYVSISINCFADQGFELCAYAKVGSWNNTTVFSPCQRNREATLNLNLQKVQQYLSKLNLVGVIKIVTSCNLFTRQSFALSSSCPHESYFRYFGSVSVFFSRVQSPLPSVLLAYLMQSYIIKKLYIGAGSIFFFSFGHPVAVELCLLGPTRTGLVKIVTINYGHQS